MSIVEGIVKSVDEEKAVITVISSDSEPNIKTKPIAKSKKAGKKTKKQDVLEYKAPADAEIYVKKGDKVVEGQPLCQGSLDLKKLFKATGSDHTQRYIVKEIQRIYAAEGIDIHDKHIEIMVRQMFSRLRIADAGDGPWVPGQIITRAEFEEKNKELKAQNKKEAKGKPILLGISRVALTSDSFLSSASFQETSRVLISAALEGKEDKLFGLKENVMIGRIIPAGTGLRK